jgi:adenine/guanine phosphoribosyltransferase-like PRPP-binding protein
MACGSCNKPKDTSLPIAMGTADFAIKRQVICAACEHSEGDICKITEEKHPGKASIAHGVVRRELRCSLPEPKWTEEPMQCPACSRGNQIITLKDGICKWCILRENVTGKPRRKTSSSFNVPKTRSGDQRLSRSSFQPTGKPQWVSCRHLAIDTQTLVSRLPHDIDAIVGVSRSGLDIATSAAKYLQLPLYAFRQSMGDVVSVGSGWRLGLHPRSDNRSEMRVVVIDDTVMTGNSTRSINSIVRPQFKQVTTAAIYVNPLAKVKPDLWVHDLGWPHLLEWNVFNSILSHNMAMDFDGILCHDCPRGSDDDGPRYLDFIRNAMPLYLPRKSPIPLIVTARIEKYRAETEAWLRKWRINFHRLVMHPAATLAERNQDDIAAYKARHFDAWATVYKPRPAPLAFIESDDRQARRIAEITGRMVICPATEGVYVK